MRRTWAGVAAVVTLVAACSSDNSVTGSPTTTTAAGGSTTAAAPVTTAAPTTTASGSTTSIARGTTTAPATGDGQADLNAVRVRLTQIADLEEPIFLATRPGDSDTIYVAERPGRLRAIRNGAVVDQPVVSFPERTRASGERGFLGFTFSPDGGELYVHYTDTNGDTNVDEYVVAADGSIDPATRRQILFHEQPYPNHNGGEVIFGPDGYMYIGLGDGGSAGDPQRNGLSLGSILGKILRIDPTASGGQAYTIPADNPFVGDPNARPEIWSYGLRNPWRFSFDATTGDLWIGDVGQGSKEEIDLSTAADGAGKGVNFGWSAFEGSERFNDDQPTEDAVPPLLEYGRDGGYSVTGGYVYRGSAIPALQGAYLYADYGVDGVRAITVDNGRASAAVPITDGPGSIASFGEGPGNELYVLSLDGGVYRIDPA